RCSYCEALLHVPRVGGKTTVVHERQIVREVVREVSRGSTPPRTQSPADQQRRVWALGIGAVVIAIFAVKCVVDLSNQSKKSDEQSKAWARRAACRDGCKQQCELTVPAAS